MNYSVMENRTILKHGKRLRGFEEDAFATLGTKWFR